jgi:methylthioribose-1-phosphate isomerase
VGVQIENPAFDVTPAKYVTAIVTERGIARAPYEQSLAELVLGQQSAAII